MLRSRSTVNRRTVAVAWLLAGLLVVLPAGHHAVAGLLVCFGADGHVDIEDGRWSDCATSTLADPHASAPEVQQVDTDDCGDCIDVPLMANPNEGRVAVVKPASPAPDLQLAVAELVDLSFDATSPAPARLHLSAPPTAVVELRTVVLRV